MSTTEAVESVDLMVQIRRDRACGEAREATLLLDLVDERRAAAQARGASDPAAEASFVAEEVAVETRETHNAVLRRLHAGNVVRAKLPRLWAAFGEGTVDQYRVILVADAAHVLERDESFVKLDAKAADYAASHTPGQLRSWLKRMLMRLEPDRVIERRKAKLEDRGVWFTHDDDGVSTMTVMMPTEDALLLERSLTLRGKQHQQSHNGLTLEQARADATVDALLGRDDIRPPQGRFHVGITVPAETLLGLSTEPAVSSDGRHVIDPITLRGILTEAGTLFSRIALTPLGRVLDVTELGRFPSAELSRSVKLVDGVCGFPTCEAPAVNDDLDHNEPWPSGKTRGPNIFDLCRRHHRMKTLGIATTFIDHRGRHTWRLSSGRNYTSTYHLHRVIDPSSVMERRARQLVAS